MSEADDTDTSPAKTILADIRAYEREFEKWIGRGKGILDRYRDVRGEPANQALVIRKYNILWANVETLEPTLYARVPQVAVERRFKDSDPVGKLASEIGQRLGNYIIQTSGTDTVFRQCVRDVLLPGRALAWINYDVDGEDRPVMEDYQDDEGKTQQREKMKEGTEEPETEFEKIHEAVRPEYVDWKDFGHSPRRTWAEVKKTGGVWRIVYMDKDRLIKRFGKEKAETIPLDRKVEDKKESTQNPSPQASIYEVWWQPTNKVYWFHTDIKDPLDESAPPVKLETFWPCPEPLYATMTNESLVPIPDFIYYQDQANELDVVTNRIARLVDALKIVGVYDASQPKLERILSGSGSPDNALVPVESWGAFVEKGGISGAISLVPIKDIADALIQLYAARDQIINVIYQVTGISDIIRGSSDPNETLGAQQLKGQYGSVRIRDRQQEVATFCRDTARIIIECAVQMFEPKLISDMVMAESFCPLSQQEQMMRQAGQQQGVTEFPPPQSFMQALKMLKDDKMRSFHIDIETDSTIALNEDQDKVNRTEFVKVIGGFIEGAAPLVMQAPELGAFVGETLKYLAKGYRAGRPLEGAIDQLVEQIEQKAKQAATQGPPPNPKMIEAQASAQQSQAAAQEHVTNAQANMADVQRMGQKDQMEAVGKAKAQETDAKLKAADIVAKHVSPIAGAKMAVAAVNPRAA